MRLFSKNPRGDKGRAAPTDSPAITRYQAAQALEEIMGDEWPAFARAVIEWVERNAPPRPSRRPHFWFRFRCSLCSMRWEMVLPLSPVAPDVACPGCDQRGPAVQVVAILRAAPRP